MKKSKVKRTWEDIRRLDGYIAECEDSDRLEFLTDQRLDLYDALTEIREANKTDQRIKNDG